MTKLIISTSENPKNKEEIDIEDLRKPKIKIMNVIYYREKEITRLMIEIDILEKRIEELNNMINKLDKVIVMKNKEKKYLLYIFTMIKSIINNESINM